MKDCFVNSVTVAALCVLLFTSTYGQKRECVTVDARIPRVPLKQLVDEMLDVDGGFSYAMQDFEFVVFARITHRVRALSDLSRTTISLWTRAAHGGVRLPFSRDEVEIACGENRYWFPIFKQYIGDILHMTRAGEGIYLHVWGLGVRDSTPVFYIVNFGSVNEWGDREEVLEDALEGATEMTGPEESLAIVNELEYHWSGDDWWQDKSTQIAVDFIKSVGHLEQGRLDAAEPYLARVRKYIAQNPDDDFTQDMLPAVVRLAFRHGLQSRACCSAMCIESPDDDIEEAFCETCLRTVVHAEELGKTLAAIAETDSTSYDDVLERTSSHATYSVNGMQVKLTADPATGIVTEKRVMLRNASEDTMDWMESVMEDLLDEFEEENEGSAHPAQVRTELLRSQSDGEEVLEVVIGNTM